MVHHDDAVSDDDRDVLLAGAQQQGVVTGCVFRKSVTGVFGIVTDGFGNVTGHFGDVTDVPSLIS